MKSSTTFQPPWNVPRVIPSRFPEASFAALSGTERQIRPSYPDGVIMKKNVPIWKRSLAPKTGSVERGDLTKYVTIYLRFVKLTLLCEVLYVNGGRYGEFTLI